MRIEELKGKTVSEARVELENRTVSELKAVCKEHGAKGYSGATKMQLVDKIIDIAAYDMWLLKLGTGRIEGNNVWIEYADGTTEVISGEIPATAQPVENKPHYVFEIGKKYAGKLNGEPTVFTVEDYEEDVIALTAANGEFHSCIVGYFIEGAFGKSDTVTMRNSKWTVSVTARDIVEEQPAEEAEARTIPAPVQAEDANFGKEIIKLLLEALEERKAETTLPLLRIDNKATEEAFKALSVTEKIKELTAVNANAASRYVYMCDSDEVKIIAQKLGARTENSLACDVFALVVKALEVREQRERIEKLIELGADEKRIRAELCFKGEVLTLLAHEIGIEVKEVTHEEDVVNRLIAYYFKNTGATSQPEVLYEDEAFSDALGDNSCPDQDIPEAHTPDEFTAWTNEDFYFYFPDGEMTELELVELTLEELDALNEYLARKEAEKWKELDEIRARQKYPLVVVKKGNVPPEDMMLYPIGMYDSYEEMKYALDKNFEMVNRCKDGTDMQYLFYTCNLHTAYMMLKARGYETRFEEWQSMKDNVVYDFIRQEIAQRENFLKRETISQKKEEITAMARKYAEISGTIQVIREGVTEIRKCIKMLEKQGQPHDGLLSVIEGAKDEYHRLRREGFLLWRKLLRVMSVEEIRRVCEAFIARCEEEKRRHMRK